MKKYRFAVLVIAACVSSSALAQVTLKWSFTIDDAVVKARAYAKQSKIDLKGYAVVKAECIDCEDLLSEYKKPHWAVGFVHSPGIPGGHFTIEIDRNSDFKLLKGE